MPRDCSVCKKAINEEVYKTSKNQHGKALCNDCQKTVTPQALKLSKALDEKRVNHTLEYDDGFKHVDIAIQWAKIYLEIEGLHHLYTPNQMLTDYERDKYSLKDGFYTIRIPNKIIQDDVRSVTESVSDLARERYREIVENQKKTSPNGTSKTVVETPPRKISRITKKTTLALVSVILILCISIAALSVIMLNTIDTLQTTNNSLESQLSSLQKDLNDLQSEYDQLYSEYDQLLSDPSSQSLQIAELENQIASLQSQLTDATNTIAQLQGQTGILPT